MNFWIFKTSKLLFGDVHTILFLTFFVLSCESYLGRKNYFDLFRTPDCLSAQHKGVFSTLLVKTFNFEQPCQCLQDVLDPTHLFIQRQRLMNQQDLACFPSDNFLCILISVPRMRTELLGKKKKDFCYLQK